MFARYRRSHLHSTPSLLSLASSVDSSIKEETLPNPTTLADCDDQLETFQILLQTKSKEKSSLINQMKDLRSEKEPLLTVKSTIQEDICAANLLINAKSEEVTHLKQKLRHHSEKQIQDNIERLEFQLRNNNYKPREEQKILDEIWMLKRSVKTLTQFELKQRENKKYRTERSRLIDQRNEVFSKVQAIVWQDEEMKREIYELRHVISSTLKNTTKMKGVLLVLAAALLSCKGVEPVSPNLTLYSEQGESGIFYTTSDAKNDLRDIGFDDLAKSVCGVGLWFLYEKRDYERGSDFVHTFANHEHACENLDSSMWSAISSVRYAGIDDIDYDTLTLYQFHDMCGSEFLVLRDIAELDTYDDRTTSLAVTGSSAWTLYADSGYSGGAACIIPTQVDGWYYGTWDIEQLNFPGNELSSVKKGCHVTNVHKYVPKN